MGSLANGMGRTDAFAARFRNGGSWRNSALALTTALCLAPAVGSLPDGTLCHLLDRMLRGHLSCRTRCEMWVELEPSQRRAP